MNGKKGHVEGKSKKTERSPAVSNRAPGSCARMDGRALRLKRILWILIALWAGFGASLAGTADAAWYNPSWPYRQKITDPANSVFANAQGSGNDILFTAADGSTKLNHEIERFDPTAKVLL